MTNASRHPTGASVGAYAPVNGLQLYYEVHGVGRPLVLLPGGSCTVAYSFEQILPSLAATRMVIAVEPQGHGHTADIDRPISYWQMADDTASLLESIGIPSADLLGWSDGGNIALQMAIRHPHLVRKVVVSGANYARSGLTAEGLEWFATVTAESWPARIREAYERVAPDPGYFPTFLTKLKEMWLHTEDWPPGSLRAIGAQVLIMNGDQDTIRVEHAVEMYRLIPTAQLAILPGTGHRTLIERPEWFLAMTEAFLDAPTP